MKRTAREFAMAMRGLGYLDEDTEIVEQAMSQAREEAIEEVKLLLRAGGFTSYANKIRALKDKTS